MARLRPWLLLTAILAAALGVRLISLTREAVWYDEIMAILWLDRPNLIEYLREVLPRNSAPPGFMITEYFWSRLAGTSVMVLRVWPLICGVAGLGVFFTLTRRLLGERTGLLATLWLSLVHWHIFYSQEIRYYPLSTLFALFSVLTFVELAAAPRPAKLAVHLVMNACMVWTHPLTAFLCVAQAFFLLSFRRNHWRILSAWFGLHALLALSLVAFLASLDQRVASAQIAWIPTPTLWGRSPSLFNFLVESSGVVPLSPTNGTGRALLPLQPWAGGALILLHTAAALLGLRAVSRPDSSTPSPAFALPPRQTTVLLVLWLLVPPLLMYALSHLWRPMFVERYVLFASFPIYILLAHFLTTRPRVIATLALALLITYDALFYFPGPMRWPFDRVAAEIQEESSTPPIIYVDDMLVVPSIEFYWRGPKPEFHSPLELPEAGEAAAKRNEDVWLIMMDGRRYERRIGFLREDGFTVATRKFSAGHPLWTIRVLPRNGDRQP